MPLISRSSIAANIPNLALDEDLVKVILAYKQFEAKFSASKLQNDWQISWK